MTPYRLSLTALADPYPAYREFRDRDPAHYSAPEDIWVLTRYADVSRAFQDWRTWSSQRRGNLLNDMPERIGRTLGTTDPPDHRFARGLVEKAFTWRTVEGLLPKIDALAGDLARSAEERDSLELVADVSAPFNASILGAMFGVPDEDFLRLRQWLDDFFLRAESVEGHETPQAVAMRKLGDYLGGLVADRLERPRDDLLSAMLQVQEGGRSLSREQVVVTTMTFLTAGFESTSNLFTNLAHALAVHPDVYRRVRDSPELIPGLVEEGMRWDAAAQGFVRTPTRDVTLHGRTIPEGAQVLLQIGSANRDERAFADPDRFDVDRRGGRHLGLGHGIHYCVGSPLARAMTQSLFKKLLAASRRWEVDISGVRRVETPNFRGFSVLPMRIGSS